MSGRDQDNRNETTHERPSSFRDMLLRDRRLVSRRQMDRRLRNRAAERDTTNGNDNGNGDHQPTYFPALSRMFSGGTSAEIQAVAVVVILVVGAFFFGRWVG